MVFPSPFILMLRQCFSRRTLNPTLTPIVHCLVLLVLDFSDVRRTSKRLAKKVDTVNMGPECRKPSRQIGNASSPLSSSSSSSSSPSSSFSSKSELETHVAAMLKIKEDHPEASAAVQDTIDFMFGQHHTIEFLSRALASIRAEMKGLLSDLKLDEEAERIIDTMQSGILTILDLLDVGDGVVDPAVGVAAPAAPASSSSSSSSSSSAATAPTAREKGALEPHHQTGVVREHGGGQQIQEQTQAMGAQGCGQGAHRSCAVICNKGSGRSERRRRFLLPLRVCFVCLWALLLRARWWPWGLCGCSGVWFPLLYFNKKRPDLAGSTRGEHATNFARFIRRGLASLW